MAPWHPDFSAFIPVPPLSSSCTGTLLSIPSPHSVALLLSACGLGPPDELGEEGGLWTVSLTPSSLLVLTDSALDLS